MEEARELLECHAGRLDPEGVRALTLAATGSEAEAEAAWVRAVDAELRRGADRPG